jgi:hypothetical protein
LPAVQQAGQDSHRDDASGASIVLIEGEAGDWLDRFAPEADLDLVSVPQQGPLEPNVAPIDVSLEAILAPLEVSIEPIETPAAAVAPELNEIGLDKPDGADSLSEPQRPARLGGRGTVIAGAALSLVAAGLIGTPAIRLLRAGRAFSASAPAPPARTAAPETGTAGSMLTLPPVGTAMMTAGIDQSPANGVLAVPGLPPVPLSEVVAVTPPAPETQATRSAEVPGLTPPALPDRLPLSLIQVRQPTFSPRSESTHSRMEPAGSSPGPPSADSEARPESIPPESVGNGPGTLPLASATPLPSLAAPLESVGVRPEVSAAAGDTLAIQAVIGRYQTAFSNRNAQLAKSVWPSLDERKLEKAFEQLDQQEISFDACTFEVSGGGAAAACQGHARYVRKVGNRSERVETRRWVFRLTNTSEGWTISTVQTW